MDSYKIKLPQFEGPFDLLLFFIERDELEIYDIPISKLTNDFLDYIHSYESLNIEVASEFILFVSTLMRIKAKMLLPRRELDVDGNEIDPRQELVDKILEYKRFKQAAEQMTTLEAERLLKYKRGNLKSELESIGEESAEGSEIQTISMFKLLNHFEKVMKRFEQRQNKPQHIVNKYNYSLEGQRFYLLNEMKQRQQMPFELLMETFENRIHGIFTFLAILELTQQNYLQILIGEGRNNFIVQWNNEREEDPIQVSIDPVDLDPKQLN